MPTLNLEPLPSRAGKGDILRLLIEKGGLDRVRVGKIDIQGRTASVEIPTGWEVRLIRALDGVDFLDRPLRAWITGTVKGEDHFTRLTALLEIESDAEAHQIAERVQSLPPDQAEADGRALVGLVYRDGHPGLGGRYLLSLGKRNPAQELPWTRLESGAPVVLSIQGAKRDAPQRGVVSQKGDTFVEVAFNDPPDDAPPGTVYRLDLAPDEASRVRQRQALERARSAEKERLAELRSVLLGETEAVFNDPVTPAWLDESLNDSQREAVTFALSARDLAILHGPPGTGKTTTVVELVRQSARRGERVLVCAPSNLAVDNVLERLLAHGEKAVRLGHPARVLPALREHTLDLLVERHPDSRSARKLARDAFHLFRQAGKWTRAKPEPGMKADLRADARALLAAARQMEARAVEGVLDEAEVLCSTLTSLDAEVIGRRRFDLLVIDEACQSTEPACWIPLLRADRVVLAGDHRQLPPTVLSADALKRGFGISLLERLVEAYGERVTRLLAVQYRMNERIMEFSSRQFYDGALIAHDTVKGHRLCDLPGVSASALTEEPVLFLDTAGAGYDEELEPEGESKLNPQEATLAAKKVRELLACGVLPADIAVIAPYSAQVRRLRRELADVDGLEVDSVDGFQGREKEAVVISLVRSNPEGEIGFLADVRRTNVALTRARRKLIVIGDSATLSGVEFYKELFEYFEAIGAYYTVWEEM
jgi:ATP-dependent RNA/DNA helicase IGHMBP2